MATFHTAFPALRVMVEEAIAGGGPPARQKQTAAAGGTGNERLGGLPGVALGPCGRPVSLTLAAF